MFVWLNAHRTETTKATKPRASPRSSAVPIRRPRTPARTHAAPKADAFSGDADGPVDRRESARRHLFRARRDLARQSRAAVRRAGWRGSQRMPFRLLRPGGVLRPTEVGTYGSAWPRSAGATGTAQAFTLVVRGESRSVTPSRLRPTLQRGARVRRWAGRARSAGGGPRAGPRGLRL